jgi:hypothetical protein
VDTDSFRNNSEHGEITSMICGDARSFVRSMRNAMLMTYVSPEYIYIACICNLTRQFDDLRAYELTSLRGFWCSDSGGIYNIPLQ